MEPDWQPDILGDGYEAAQLPLDPDAEGAVVATLVRHRAPSPTRRAVLYVHGYSDYFFQTELATFFADRSFDFYAVDLRKYGRSLRPHQTPNYCSNLADYEPDLDAAADAVAADGHDSVVLVAHSTGGLVASLWAARRREQPIEGVVLNSPFFEFRQDATTRFMVGAAAGVVAKRWPARALPGKVSTAYGDSIHASAHGEWDYDLRWKPAGGFPARAGWLDAVRRGHRRLHEGLELSMPVLVMCSTRSVSATQWNLDMTRADAILDADSIARWSPSLGRHVTCVRVDGGMHDLFLSARPVRDCAYEILGRWTDAWLGRIGRPPEG